MQTGTAAYSQYRFTIFLLCLGYFIDFYDLTIFSASYSDIIKDLFHISSTEQTQLLYLQITNFHTAGIICGGLLFGVLGDKFGRTTVIRYSILLYSITITLSCFTHSITLFIILRFLTGAGLAAEFATSSVLISEMLPQPFSSRSTACLYFCGILGGITATFLGSFSWKIMFLFGGSSGFILYLMRKSLYESPLFLNLAQQIPKGNLWYMFKTQYNCIKTIKLTLLIAPFYFLISIMFILPGFMQLQQDLAPLIHTLLIGFFTGNIISTISCSYFVNKFKDFSLYFIINSILFILILAIFKLISPEYFFFYSILLGLIGGGLPTIWIQMVAKSYATNHRNTATNTLYVIGRGSSIGFNILISYWLATPKYFTLYCIITILVLGILSILAIITSKNMYISNIDYLEL